MKPFVCIITGPCGSGKSTILKSLAKQEKKSVYIEADYIWDFVKNGKVSPFAYTKESKKMLNLKVKNICDITNNFLKAGFNVFIEDILERDEEMKLYNKLLYKKPEIFLLLPNKKTICKRDRRRAKKNQMGKRALELHSILSKFKDKRKWHILDTSNHTAYQTKKEILQILKK